MGYEGAVVIVRGGIRVWSAGGVCKAGYERVWWAGRVQGGMGVCRVGHKAARWDVGVRGGTRVRGRALGRAPGLNKSPLPLEGAEPLK